MPSQTSSGSHLVGVFLVATRSRSERAEELGVELPDDEPLRVRLLAGAAVGDGAGRSVHVPTSISPMGLTEGGDWAAGGGGGGP